MKPYCLFAFVLITGVLLTACSNSAAEQELVSNQPRATVPEGPVAQEPESAPTEVSQAGDIAIEQAGGSSGDQVRAMWPDGEVQLDKQGLVEVAVTPLNLNATEETLNFTVELNTHSVDLSMDLASSATLAADNGLDVQATLWDAPRGGHHVSGVLSFPAAAEGKSLLDGASRLTLKIYNIDAPERSFSWSLNG